MYTQFREFISNSQGIFFGAGSKKSALAQIEICVVAKYEKQCSRLKSSTNGSVMASVIPGLIFEKVDPLGRPAGRNECRLVLRLTDN